MPIDTKTTDALAKHPAVSRLQHVPATRLLNVYANRARFSGARLSPMSADQLKTLGPWTEANQAAPKDNTLSLVETVHAAADATDATRTAVESKDKAFGLTVSVKNMKVRQVPEPSIMGTGEVYVIGSVLDASGEQPNFRTKLFEGMNAGNILPLGPGGLLVGLIRNPRWFVDFHCIVMESDEDIRSIGRAIEQARVESGLKEIISAIGALTTFDPTMITKVITTVDVFIALLQRILISNGDDHIATIHDFYLKSQGFGVGEKFVATRGADITYRFDVTEI